MKLVNQKEVMEKAEVRTIQLLEDVHHLISTMIPVAYHAHLGDVVDSRCITGRKALNKLTSVSSDLEDLLSILQDDDIPF